MIKVEELRSGRFLDEATNILCFGLPGVGKSHVAAAIGHALVDKGHPVLSTPIYALVQEMLAAKRDLQLPRALRKLDAFEPLILDDIGYVQQTALPRLESCRAGVVASRSVLPPPRADGARNGGTDECSAPTVVATLRLSG